MDQFKGLKSCGDRARNNNYELAWQNDWITRLISSYEKRSGRWCDTNNSEWGNIRFAVSTLFLLQFEIYWRAFLLVCLLAGRTKAIRKFHEHTKGFQDAEINARLVAYCSDQAHSSVEKAALIGLVRMRFIEADENLSLRGEALREAIEEDIKNGLVPFWVRTFSFINLQVLWWMKVISLRMSKSHKKICHAHYGDCLSR